MLDRTDIAGDKLGGVLDEVAAREVERTLVHPNQRAFEMARRGGPVASGDEVAPADVNLVLQAERHRHGRPCFGEVASERGDAGHAGVAVRRRNEDLVAGTDGAGGDLAGIT